jgi:hypothetical protein
MSSRLLPAAVLALGLGFSALAIVALVDRAFVAAPVIGAVGVAHMALAAGLERRSTAAAIAGGALGLVEIATVAFGLWFILGIELGVGLDLTAAWFAPLNGYATVAASVAILAVDAALVRPAALAIRGGAAVAILV